MLRRRLGRKRSRKLFTPKLEQMEARLLLAANVTEVFRSFEFDWAGTFEGEVNFSDPGDEIAYDGITSGSGSIEYTSPIAGSGQLDGEASGNWDDGFDIGTFTGEGIADVIETDGVLNATEVSGSGSLATGPSISFTFGGLNPGDAVANIDLLMNEAAVSWDLDLEALLGTEASTQGTASVSLTPELTGLTDLSPISGAFTNSGGVEFAVEATGQLVPTANRADQIADVQLFWASGPTVGDSLGSASMDEVPMHWNTGTVTAEVDSLTAAPEGATHLLVVADSDSQLLESNEDNNVLALALMQAGKITGGGALDAGLRNFGFVINTRVTGGVQFFQGNLQYNDREAGIRLHSVTLDTLQIDGGTATFTGQGRVNGRSGYSFTVVVSDSGEPGRGADTFSIIIEGPDGFSYDSNLLNLNDGVIEGGNILFHSLPVKKRR
jgi:hypothetical protein